MKPDSVDVAITDKRDNPPAIQSCPRRVGVRFTACWKSIDFQNSPRSTFGWNPHGAMSHRARLQTPANSSRLENIV